jgi:predicted amidophosphoribosyltransferase
MSARRSLRPARIGQAGRVRSRRQSLAAALADLVLPRICAGCGVPGAVLCRRCAGLFAAPHLATPRRFPDGFPPTVAAAVYAGPVRPTVNAFKERGHSELARPLGVALALAVAAVVSGVPGRGTAQHPAARHPVHLVPVPSSAAALRARGRDHVRELTLRAVAELRAAGVAAEEVRLLRRRGRLRDSAGLSAAQRRANLAGTFVVAGRAPDGLLVIVDDVVTSGATLTEAAAEVAARRSPGAPPVLAAVVAATPREAPRTGTRVPGGQVSGPGRRD